MKKRGITEQYLINNDLEDGVLVSQIKKGELVKRKPDSNIVYMLEDYNRCDKTYTLTDYEDVGRCIFVKAKTKLFLKFNY